MDIINFTLLNGIRIVFLPNNSLVSYVGFFINSGSRDENPQQHGLAHFIEHVLFKGTQKRKPHQIFAYIENVGGELNAFTTKEETCIQASLLKEYLNRGLEIISDILLNATFPDDEIAKEKNIIIDEINSIKDNPSEYIFEEFEQNIFNNSSLGRSILGNPDHINNFTRHDIFQFILKNYTTDQMVISIVGNYTENYVKKLVDKYFGNIVKSLRNFERFNHVCYQPFNLEIEKNYNQAHCLIGTEAYSFTNNRRIILALINNILGGPSMNARLNLTLREKHGYTYNVESIYSAYCDSGIFCVYFTSEKKNVRKCVDLVIKEFDRLRTKKMSTQQLSIAKNQFLGQLAIKSENKEHMMLVMGKSFLVYNNFESLSDIKKKLEKISSSDILDVANELLTTDRLSLLLYK